MLATARSIAIAAFVVLALGVTIGTATQDTGTARGTAVVAACTMCSGQPWT
jgi:hypothetical protein